MPLLEALKAAQSSKDLETALVDIVPQDFIGNSEVLAELNNIMDQETLVSTSKQRRRIKRLIVSLSTCENESSGPDNAPNYGSHAIKVAATENELENALNGIVMSQLEENDIKILIDALESKSNCCPFDVKRKLQRRMVRLIYALRNLVSGDRRVGDTEESITNDKNAKAHPVEGPGLQQDVFQLYCESIESAVTSIALEKALGAIDTSIIQDTASRLKLVTLLQSPGTQKLCDNAKSRRRVRRMILTLHPESKTSAVDTVERNDFSSENTSTHKEDNIPVIPYIVFVGQLDFAVKASDLHDHFRNGGVEGNITVRLNTDPTNGRSKGTAFVELDGPQELHKCMGLHHTMLQGRRINVEKTCGGRNKELRSQRIKSRRESQKIRESQDIDRIVNSYSSSTGIDIRSIDDILLNRVYSCTMSEVSKLFESLKNIVADSPSIDSAASLTILRNLLAKKDTTGSYTDLFRAKGLKRRITEPSFGGTKKSRCDT